MNRYRLKNINFDYSKNRDDLSEDMKIIKIVGAFNVSVEEAKRILVKINNKESIDFVSLSHLKLTEFGMCANKEDLEVTARREQEEKDRQLFWKNHKKTVPLAEAWYESLGAEHKKFVDTLVLSRYPAPRG